MQHPEALELKADKIAAGLVIVFEHWGAPAGFVVVVPRDDGNADMGRKLVEEAAQFAIAIEAAMLIATASPRAEPFYAKCGFRPSSVRSTPHGPVSVMQRSLVF